MGKEVYSTEAFLEAVEEAEKGDHIVFVDEKSPRQLDDEEIKLFRSIDRLARKKGVHTSLVGAPYDIVAEAALGDK